MRYAPYGKFCIAVVFVSVMDKSASIGCGTTSQILAEVEGSF
jgi:hypothetical protein